MWPNAGTRRVTSTEDSRPIAPVQRRNGTPSHSPRHSRAFQDSGDSEPESGNVSEGSTSNRAEPKQVVNDKSVLLVGGKKFTVNPAIFLKHPETMLGRMFGSKLSPHTTSNGEVEVARGMSPTVFKHVLDYFRKGYMDCPSSVSIQELREACDYFIIPFNETTVHTTNLCDLMHELSNVGARQQFEDHIEHKLLPILVDCAKKGERECHIIVLLDDDNVDWDAANPPYMGDDQIQRVVSSELLRFLKYFENREIANEVLREKGMKKVRFGVEGYPTTKEKVRVRPSTGRTEVVYNYVQRPFICMSWEKDEAKSRHVDFTCVRVKTDIDPESEAATLVGDHMPRDHEEPVEAP